MKAFFVSPYPKFKSYKNPDKKGVEDSPYFWWWYALTLNAEYCALCEQMASGGAKPPKTTSERKMHKVYYDWGDVRYQGDRYIAFAAWFTRKESSNGLTVGIRVFAEPPLKTNVRLVETGADAKALLKAGGVFLVVIPLKLRREHVDKRLDLILKKHLGAVKGREVRDPSASRALYHLTKAAVPATLKKAFDLYDAKEAAKANGERVVNYFLFTRVGLDVKQRVKKDEVNTNDAKRRSISAQVTRHIKNANAMIKHSALGQFP